jgi:hypothetical protein
MTSEKKGGINWSHVVTTIVITAIVCIGGTFIALNVKMAHLEEQIISIKENNKKNQFEEAQKNSKVEEALHATNIPSTNSQIKPNVKVQQENSTHVSQMKPDNLTQLQRGSIKSDNEFDNEVQHEGYLKIKVLENKQPIPFVNYWVSCAKPKGKTDDSKALSQEIFIGDFSGIAFINCKINDDRWFLEVGEPMMPNCHIVINGKIIPDKYIVMTNDNKSSNYTIKLKRIR